VLAEATATAVFAKAPRSRCKDCGGSGLCEHQRQKPGRFVGCRRHHSVLPRQQAKMRRGSAVIVFCMCIHAGADRNNLDKGEIWEHKKEPIQEISWKGPTSCASSQPIPAFFQPLQVAEGAVEVEAAAREEAAWKAQEERQVAEQDNTEQEWEVVATVEMSALEEQEANLASEDVALHNLHHPPFVDRQSDIDRDRDNPGGQDGAARTDSAGSAEACRRRVHILQPTAGACFIICVPYMFFRNQP